MAHRPTGLAPVEHRLLHKQRLVSASRPHRARPGGAQASAPEWSVRRPLLLSSSLRSTETSSVGAGNAPRCPSGAEASAPPRQARWGRGTRRAAPLVQKPPLHRDKLGGGGAPAGLVVIGGILLFVRGIGIINIMLSTV